MATILPGLRVSSPSGPRATASRMLNRRRTPRGSRTGRATWQPAASRQDNVARPGDAVQALITTPGTPGSTRTATIAEPGGDAGLRVRTLEIGVCGTDREITAGEFGEAPPGERDLVLGHEFVGRVERDGHG